MNKIWQSLEGLSFIIFLLGIFYLIHNNLVISSRYNIPSELILIVVVLGLIYISYQYLKMYVKSSKLEYEFTSIVNHTFRTPLTRIMWLVKELEVDMPQKDRALYLQNISNATSKILDIVDLFVGIKDINNTASYYFEAISIRDIVEQSINKYREEINKKNITFQVSTFKEVPLLTLDIKKISFVIDTLVENAIYYTPKDGKVSIDYTYKPSHVVINVSDTGLGLSLKDKIRIFSRFYRSKDAVLKNADGMGLKLYLSKQIIKRHKGNIYAKSRGRNKGTKFLVELPLHK